MKIKKIAIRNFKRFTDLEISAIPDSSKLVLLIGSNGSGKSSLFDAFDWLSKGMSKAMPYSEEQTKIYYRKDVDASPFVSIEFTDGTEIEKGEQITKGRDLIRKFIGRSSIRIIPHISDKANFTDIALDKDSPATYIENDIRFTNDAFSYIQQVNNALREPVFSGKQVDVVKIFKDFIDPLNKSLLNIFGGDENTTIQIAEFRDATPIATAQLIFKKGVSKINYDLLSHGEKQVVTLLINFIVRQEYYKDAIIFIDEMDCHLNTALQYNLLEEIVNQWIPDNSQLWTASHALGFIDYAKKSDTASIIDFDLLNFDTKQELTPLAKENMEVYEIAIPKSTIASILKRYKLVVVENKNDEYFNAALGQEGFLFLPANNSREVFLTIKEDDNKLGLRDRDYLRDDEIEQIRLKFPHLKILSLYTFENYIYHPDNIAELKLQSFNKEEYIAEIMRQKDEKLIDIVSEIGTSRQHYVEFRDCIKNDGNIKPITDALQSGDFALFYPYFNMKNHFSRNYLSSLNLTVAKLSQTKWFKTEISKIIEA